jgi:hypothetical protein
MANIVPCVSLVLGIGMLRVDRDNRIFFAIDSGHLFLQMSD